MATKFIIDLSTPKELNALNISRLNGMHLCPTFSSLSLNSIYTMLILFRSKVSKGDHIKQASIYMAEDILLTSGYIKLLARASNLKDQTILESANYKLEPFVYYSRKLAKEEPLIPSRNDITIQQIYMVTPALIHLFAQYRQFYQQPSNLKECEVYLKARLHNKESLIFVAHYNNKPAGFLQLYPDFTQTGCSYTLNDLYVDVPCRGLGIASALITHIHHILGRKEAIKITLKTAFHNPARKLYEKLGYTEEKEYISYYKELKATQPNPDYNHKINLDTNRLYQITIQPIENNF